MDTKQELCFPNTTTDNIMAATMAPTTTATSTAVDAITSSTSTFTSSSYITCTGSTSADFTNDVCNNFHELCRSCGKTNEELYDLFQTTIPWNTTPSASTASPFNTSSTTCYTHLNTSSTSNKQPSSLSSSKPTTFDSVAATAKATAKGQSNMENILQEMQIWHLQIKCNDGLPQRICAKCTAQFYMIHKFRRKCLKVQTQLRGLYEEEQLLLPPEVNERQQQQLAEKDTNITIVPTSTPTPPTSEVEVPTPAKSLTIVNDLINDNYGKKQALSQKFSSVNFERNTWNANDDATLLDDVVKTMAETEANEPTPKLAAYGKQKEYVTLLAKDVNEPQMVLNSEKPFLTLKKHKEQKCDNDVVVEKKKIKKNRTKSVSSSRARLCIDQEEKLTAHIIFKSNTNDNKQDALTQSKDVIEDCRKPTTDYDMDEQEQYSCEENNIFKLRHINETSAKTQKGKKDDEDEEEEENKHCLNAPKYITNPEGLFITKAALKAYNISQTKIPSAYDNSQCSFTSNTSITSSSLSATLSSQENPDVSQLVCANLKQPAAGLGIQQVLATVSKITNDDNNNDHNTDHHQNEQEDLTGNSNSSTPTSTFTSPSSAKKQKLVKTEVRFNRRRSFAKRAGRRKAKVANKRGHRYKLNAKLPTSRRRALYTYRATSSSASSPATSNKQRSQHELKRLQDIRTCSSTSLKHQKQLKAERYGLKNNIASKSTYEIETKNLQKININNRNSREKEEKLETPAAIMEDESSSTSTTSSASSSFVASAPTPAVTDLVKPLKEKHETNAYTTNANAIKQPRRHSPLSESSRQRNNATTTTTTASAATTCYNTNSATSTTIWKTKAAMKANANDMHIDMDVNKQQQKDNEHLTNDIEKPILLPYSATATATTCNSMAAAESSSATLCSIIDTGFKTHNENQTICHTTKNNLYYNSETVLSSKDHKVKDIKNTNQQQQQKHHNNLRPEEAAQKQIKHNNNDDEDKGKREQEGETENVLKAKEEKSETKEFINHNNTLHEQQKPITNITSTTTTPSGTTALTPPDKGGCMKLILQRKRGARFKWRRKDDILAQLETQDISPKKRKLSNKKMESKLQMESLFSLDLNGDYSKEDKELIEDSIRHIDEITNDSDILENIKEQIRIKQNNNKENRQESTPDKDINIEKEKLIRDNQQEEKRNFEIMEDTKNSTELAQTITQNKTDREKDHLKIYEKANNKVEQYNQERELNVEADNCLEYRDNNLCKNEFNEEEDEEDITNSYDLNDNIPQQFKLSKENLKLELVEHVEKPKKLIIRVPLASLTQDFKRLHLTIDQEQDNKEKYDAETATKTQAEASLNELVNPTLLTPPYSYKNVAPVYKDLNTSQLSGSSQSDLLGFSQASSSASSTNTVDSSQKSMELMRCSNHNLCVASSKINDFINDFQNNCIDSSEIDVNNEILPILPSSSKELSDEIRDVEDTLNGILSEMHDKDMYTPRSVEQEDFFPHSVYSPLTDAPTTPSQSFYAESPCTINGNPMSVSPFIQQSIDYNAMTPLSNHSSMGPNSHMSSSCGGSVGNPNVFSEHFPSYNECFAEESTQSELIGFQNDIPCFENIDLTNPASPSELIATTDLTGAINEEEPITPLKTISNNSALQGALNKNDVKIDNQQIVEYVDLCQDYPESNDPEETKESPSTVVSENKEAPEMVSNIATCNAANYQPTLQQNNPLNNHQSVGQTSDNSVITSTPHSHYIVTNTAQGPVLIANPHVNTGRQQIDAAFKPHNNLQFVTLGQALEANKTHHPTATHIINNSTPEINWSSQSNTTTNGFTQQHVIPATNAATTTYFINAGGEVYRASIPNPSLQSPNVNTLIVPPTASQQQSHAHNVTYNKSSIDASENYLQTLQQHTQQQHHRQPQQQHQLPQQSPQTSQYIMVVNNLGTTPQYYAAQANQTTAAMGSPTVLFHPAAVQNSPQTITNQCNFINNQNHMQSITPEISRPTPTNTPTTTNSISPPILASPKTTSDSSSPSQQTMHQRVNQQLQQQIKQRQLQLLQPRSPSCTQKINLICRFCHKRPKFTNNVDYSNHIINMHPAEKPYNCPHCSRHFSRRFERQHHVAQAHGSRYQCPQCGLSFCAQRTLDFHLQKHHAHLGISYEQHAASSSSSSVNQQQNSSSSSSSSATATYQLLQHNQQQRLVRVEDVQVQVTGESKNKRSIDLQLDGANIKASKSNNEIENLSATTQQQTRKLCCPDCDGDNDDCCSSKKLHDHNNHQPISQQHQQQQQHQQYTGNESVNHHHITLPSPEQTEPDSTTTLRHFRKRQLSELSPFSSSPSSSTSCSFNNSNDNVIVSGDGSGEQIVVERALRGSHNCLFCEESFTNEIALRKHHHLAHGTQATMAFVCTVCKRGFRMRNALQRHMETHDAEGRPYECNICQVRFPRPSQLTLHKLTLHKFEKPHSCEECGKQFGTESAMKAHAKVHEDATATTTSQLPSCVYMETMTTTTTTATTKNEQILNLQSTTSGEIATTDSAPLNLNNDAFNTPQTNIVSGLTT